MDQAVEAGLSICLSGAIVLLVVLAALDVLGRIRCCQRLKQLSDTIPETPQSDHILVSSERVEEEKKHATT